MLYYSIDHIKSTFTITVVPINVVGAGDKASMPYSTSKLLSDQWDLLYMYRVSWWVYNVYFSSASIT